MALFFNAAAILSVMLLGWLYWLGVNSFYLYIYPWYDIPLHLLGGLTAGFWTSAVAVRMRLSKKQAFWLTLGIILPVAVVWEIWEYNSGLTRGEPGYWFDTSKDLFNGTVGALVAWCVYSFLYKIKDK